MARTSQAGAGNIEWRRPRRPADVARERWSGPSEKPTFMQLFVPLVSLAVGSIFVIGLVLAVLVGLLTLFV